MNDRSRWIVSGLVLIHFGAIGLTYATNWHRSKFQDRALVWLQPYLIGFNWNQEMLPIEWISDVTSKSIRLSVQTKDASSQWITVLDTSENTLMRARSERLLVPLIEFVPSDEFVTSDDSQGLTTILKSIVMHLEKERTGTDNRILRIRLERNAKANEEKESESVLYEASLARFPNGEFGFVPKIERHRSVRSLESSGQSP